MDLGEMSALVASITGDTDYVITTDAQITAFLNMGQRHVARELECNEESATVVALDGNGYMPLPERFLRTRMLLWNGDPIPYRQHHGSMLNPTEIGSGSPDYYYPLARTSLSAGYRAFAFSPARAGLETVNIQHWYSVMPADLGGALGECGLPEHVHEIVVFYAVAKCKLMENDYEGYRFIMEHEVNARLTEARFELSPIPADSYGAFRDVIGGSELSSYLDY